MSIKNEEMSLPDARDEAIKRIRVLMTAAKTREQMGPTVYGSLYEPKLNKVVEPSLVANAVNPILSSPSSEVKSASVVRSNDYKGAMFKGSLEDVTTPSTTEPEEEKHRSPGLGGS